MQNVLIRAEEFPLHGRLREAKETAGARERIALRRPEEQDITELVALADDPSVATMLSQMPYPYTAKDAVRFVRNARVEKSTYAIVRTLDEAFLGCCGFRMDDDGTMAGIELWLGRRYWNCGYGTEASQRLIDLIFSTYHEVDRIDARSRVGNIASRRVLQKCGFQFQAQQLAASLALSSNIAVEWYRLDRKTWNALKQWCHHS